MQHCQPFNGGLAAVVKGPCERRWRPASESYPGLQGTKERPPTTRRAFTSIHFNFSHDRTRHPRTLYYDGSSGLDSRALTERLGSGMNTHNNMEKNRGPTPLSSDRPAASPASSAPLAPAAPAAPLRSRAPVPRAARLPPDPPRA